MGTSDVNNNAATCDATTAEYAVHTAAFHAPEHGVVRLQRVRGVNDLRERLRHDVDVTEAALLPVHED
jgi:hypothetical protein